MSRRSEPKKWWLYRGDGKPHEDIHRLPPPPPWRKSKGPALERLLSSDGAAPRFEASDDVIELVNTALYLRRPLLVTGKPGSGKSSLAEAVAYELKLGRVLRWPINTRTTLQDGLYRYDAIGRLQEAALRRERGQSSSGEGSESESELLKFLQLGPLGTALAPTKYPRVLLIDEIDKSDIDLPNDLLNVFEEGEFEIPELTRLARVGSGTEVEVRTLDGKAPTENGWVRCHAFPLVILTSNGEREFPPAFLRRCVQLELKEPDPEHLRDIVRAHLGDEAVAKANSLIQDFVERRGKQMLATDQLLNTIYLTTSVPGAEQDMEALRDILLKGLGNLGTP